MTARCCSVNSFSDGSATKHIAMSACRKISFFKGLQTPPFAAEMVIPGNDSSDKGADKGKRSGHAIFRCLGVQNCLLPYGVQNCLLPCI